ncbi:MAG: hypothetical protein WKG07_06455 [Hymenobacter sp.]
MAAGWPGSIRSQPGAGPGRGAGSHAARLRGAYPRPGAGRAAARCRVPAGCARCGRAAPVLAAVAWPAGAVVAHLAGALPLAGAQGADRGGAGGRVLSAPNVQPGPGRWTGPAVPWTVRGGRRRRAPEARLLALATQPGGDVRPCSASADRRRLRAGGGVGQQLHQPPAGNVAEALLAEAGLPAALLAPAGARNRGQGPGRRPAPCEARAGPAARRDAPTTLGAHAGGPGAAPGLAGDS